AAGEQERAEQGGERAAGGAARGAGGGRRGHGSTSGSGGSGTGEDPTSVSPRRRGRVRRKHVPSPSCDHTSSSPPWMRASSSEIARPRPVPPVVRWREGSARQKRSKTRSTCSGFMPTP